MSPRILTNSVAAASMAALLGLTACSSPTNRSKPTGEQQVASNGAATEPQAANVEQGGVEAADGSFQDAPRQLTEEQQKQEAMFREIWMTPSFQRRVAQNWARSGEIEPTMSAREAGFRLEVLKLINEKELDRAASRLRSLQGDGENAVWDFLLGQVYFGRGEFDNATREFIKAVAKEGNYKRAWEMLGFSQMRAKKYVSAVESFSQVVALGGGNAQTYGFMGLAHAQNGDYAAAESAFRLVMMMDPRDVRWKQLLSESLSRQGRYADSINLLDGLIAKDRDNATLWKSQGYAYANVGENEKAATNFEIVDRLGGSDYNSLATLGTIYFNDDLYTLSVDAFLRAVEQEDRGDHEAVLGIANRLAARSAYDEASRLIVGIEKAYAEALDPESKLAMLRLRARLAVASGATEQQVALLQEIVNENPLDGDALLQLARHYQNEGDVETAIFRYEQAARNPEFAADAKILHAQLLSNNQRYAEAEPLLEAALNIERRDDVQQLLEFVKRAKARSASKKAGA